MITRVCIFFLRYYIPFVSPQTNDLWGCILEDSLYYYCKQSPSTVKSGVRKVLGVSGRRYPSTASSALPNFVINFLTMVTPSGLHGGVVVSTVASQQEGSRFDPHLGPFCVEFVCSPRVCVGSLWVLRLPPTVQKHAC